jgi:HTH-type transcriptional regulator / antitoxin HigA
MERGLLMTTATRQRKIRHETARKAASRRRKPQPSKAKDPYFELVLRFPLRPIRSDKDLDAAVKIVDSLLDRKDLVPEEEDYLEVLGDLVEQYESEAHPIAPVSDAEMLQHLIEAKGVSQTEVSKAVGIVDSTISEVLKGKRSLSRKHIGKLAQYFGVSPNVFAF